MKSTVFGNSEHMHLRNNYRLSMQEFGQSTKCPKYLENSNPEVILDALIDRL